ncbi:MAG: pimeloyl-ACP methyl ester carboxylesterase [Maribacter sp.]|jgi:pimeloyl-ACP methyl ester carboxylesterase
MSYKNTTYVASEISPIANLYIYLRGTILYKTNTKLIVMKKITTPLFLFLMFIAWNTSLEAQVNVYAEYDLPSPNNLSPLFIGSITDSAIYYGDDSNANTNKPVVVFVHGFIDLANLWFAPGNDMYRKCYNKGYRTAFVATTRGEGMWYNGEMLSYMLDDITAYYGVNDVVIVAHSNGGKAAEVAMFTHDKYNKVNRVITLGTPFKGTGLANIAGLPGFNWVVDLIGLGGGATTSTTYYMEGVARPILDSDPDNQPNKFINYGAWGYGSGNTILSPIMFTGGLLLNIMGGGSFNGGNDGVTPYYSSTRPGGNKMWPGSCWGWWCNKQSKHDHIDIAYDYISFNYFQPWMSGALPRMEQSEEILENPMYESSFEIITSNDANGTFKIPAGALNLNVSLLQKGEATDFSLLNENGTEIIADTKTKESIGKGLSRNASIENPTAGTYRLKTKSADYLAVVSYDNGPILVYDDSKASYEQNKSVVLSAHLLETNEVMSIKGAVTLTSDLQGNAVNGESYEVEFLYKGNMEYEYHMPQGLKPGVYNVLIHAESDSYRRSAISGFAVNAAKMEVNIETQELSITNYPNPVVEMTTIRFEKMFEGDASIRLIDNLGRVVKVEDISGLIVGNHQLEWNLKSFNAGTYFLEFQNEGKTKTKRVVVLK